MSNKNISLIKLFIIFFKINMFTFGGGYTILPMFKEAFVDKRNLITEKEMYDIIAIAQCAPGAMVISAAVLLGYKIRGIVGAFVCLLASALPCIIIISLICIFYEDFKKNIYIRSMLDGISGVVSAVLLITVFQMGKVSFTLSRTFSLIIIPLIFILGYIFKISSAQLIILCAVLGFIYFNYFRKEKN